MGVPSGQGTQQRPQAQSTPLGLLLVFALVIAATTVVVALSAGAITGTQDRLGSERTENVMTQLDSQAALVALGESNRQRLDISAPGTSNYAVDATAGRMTVAYENQTSGGTTTIFSENLGRISYETSDGTTVAYQGGGVWRSDAEGGSVMVAPPEFHYRDATLTLPLVTVGSSGTVDGRATLSQSTSVRRFPNVTENSDFTNPLENARVQVTVQSDYYRAWGQYFETRTEGAVEYDHPNDRVTLVLVTPLENTRVTSASASLAASGTFLINGASPALCADGRRNYTNSYNSSGTADGYCDQTPGSEGDIVYGDDIDISYGVGGGGNQNDIYGDVVSGGTVTVTNSNGNGPPYVDGNISYSDNCNPSPTQCESRIAAANGRVEQISSIEEAPAISGIVRTRVDALQADNDNGSTNNVSAASTLDYANSGTADTVTLTAGDYYLRDIDVPSDGTVILDTTAGDINIAVEEDVTLRNGAEIEVIGDGAVDMYVQGADGSATQFDMRSGANVTNRGDDAPQFRLFGSSNFTVRIGNNGNLAHFVGVIYAPPGTSGTGSVTLDSGIVYGGVLTGTTTIESGGGSIHYDEALEDVQVLRRSDSIVRVTYVHASTNEILVDDG